MPPRWRPRRCRRVLVIVEHVDVGARAVAQRLHESVDRTVAGAVNSVSTPSIASRAVSCSSAPCALRVLRAMVDVARAAPSGARYSRSNAAWISADRELLAGRVGDRLHDLAELDLQQARQREPVVALEQVGDAALARLAVDADHGLVGAADVGGIDRQVRHVP